MGGQSIDESILFKTLMTIAVLVSVFYVSYCVSRLTRRLHPRVRSMLMGMYFGAFSVFLIWFNASLRSSDLIDVRLMMTSIVATWFGFIPAMVTLVMTVAGALVVYGAGLATGILALSLFSCAVVGYGMSRAINAHNQTRMGKIRTNLLFGIVLSL